MSWPVNCDMFTALRRKNNSQRLPLLEIDMQLKLKLTVHCYRSCSGVPLHKSRWSRSGHVAPVSGAQAHYGKDNENGATWPLKS